MSRKPAQTRDQDTIKALTTVAARKGIKVRIQGAEIIVSKKGYPSHAFTKADDAGAFLFACGALR